MASVVTRKRARVVREQQEIERPRQEQYIVDAHGKRVAVVLDLDEYRRLLAGKRAPQSVSATERARLVELARQAEGSWKETEPRGTSVEIVRRLRDEWNRPS